MYVGCCGSEIHSQWLSNVNEITGYEQTGCTLSMFANRLSFYFDFKGPSKAVDTGDSLTLLCFHPPPEPFSGSECMHTCV